MAVILRLFLTHRLQGMNASQSGGGLGRLGGDGFHIQSRSRKSIASAWSRPDTINEERENGFLGFWFCHVVSLRKQQLSLKEVRSIMLGKDC